MARTAHSPIAKLLLAGATATALARTKKRPSPSWRSTGLLCLPDKKVLALFLLDPLSSSTCVAGCCWHQREASPGDLLLPLRPVSISVRQFTHAQATGAYLHCTDKPWNTRMRAFFMRRLCSYFVCICAGGHDHWQRRKKVFFPSYNSLHCVYSYPPLLQGTHESSISFASRDLGVKYVCIFCREIVRRTYVCTLYKKQLCIRKISLIFSAGSQV